MKYLVLLCDGMADLPFNKLGDKTPMEVAFKPSMDKLSQSSIVGTVKTVPESLPAGSDVANLSVMGFNPLEYYTGRSPLEALGAGIDIGDNVSFRCNFVTLSDEPEYKDKTMLDYCGGDISSDEARVLVNCLNQALGNEKYHFHLGVSYRNCLIMKRDDRNVGTLTPPHDISDKCVSNYLPHDSEILSLMKKSYDILSNHDINKKRVNLGKNPANSIWLWGKGTAPKLFDFQNRYGVKASVISAVDLIKGIALASNMSFCKVEGASGYLDTNFKGKLDAAINEFERGQDFLYLHIEAPDECSHRGEYSNKVKAIELIDELLLTPLVDYLDKYSDYKIMVLPDHPTPLSTKTHTKDPVPFLIYQKSKPIDSITKCFTEKNAKSTGNDIELGYTLMGKFLEEG